jgi:hypothetical protein
MNPSDVLESQIGQIWDNQYVRETRKVVLTTEFMIDIGRPLHI